MLIDDIRTDTRFLFSFSKNKLKLLRISLRTVLVPGSVVKRKGQEFVRLLNSQGERQLCREKGVYSMCTNELHKRGRKGLDCRKSPCSRSDSFFSRIESQGSLIWK